jgi:hypothetical protein
VPAFVGLISMGLEAVLAPQNLLDRIRESAETTGASLEQEVKRQYVHESGAGT